MVNRMHNAAAAALLSALALAGCTTPGPVYESMVCGRQVVYHPDDLKPCANGASACTLQRGQSSYHVYYTTTDSAVMAHENEHVCGMRHREPWSEVGGKACTEVTEGGLSQWKRGDIMCRINAGAPVRIADTALRTQIASAAGWNRNPLPLYAAADSTTQSGASLSTPGAIGMRSDPLAVVFATWPTDRERSEVLRAQSLASWNQAYGDKAGTKAPFPALPTEEARYYTPLQGPRRAAGQSIIQMRDASAAMPMSNM